MVAAANSCRAQAGARCVLASLLATTPSLIWWSVDHEGGDDELPDQSGYGLSVWSRVATAANTLTVSVSKAWASNITAHSGERTSSIFFPFAMTTNRITHIMFRRDASR